MQLLAGKIQKKVGESVKDSFQQRGKGMQKQGEGIAIWSEGLATLPGAGSMLTGPRRRTEATQAFIARNTA